MFKSNFGHDKRDFNPFKITPKDVCALILPTKVQTRLFMHQIFYVIVGT